MQSQFDLHWLQNHFSHPPSRKSCDRCLATFVALAALASIRDLLAPTDFPPEISRIRLRMKGVLAFPIIPAAFASSIASETATSMSSLAMAVASGTGFANSRPELMDRLSWASVRMNGQPRTQRHVNREVSHLQIIAEA